MNSKYTLKKLRSKKKAQAQKLIDGCVVGDEVRDMNDEEKAQFEALMDDVKAIKDQLEKMDQVDDRDDDEEDEKPSEDVDKAPRSQRVSQNWGNQSPAVHTRQHRYSILKGIRSIADHKKLDGIEGEYHQELERRANKPAKGFLMPLGNEDFITEKRDLTVSTGTGAVFVVPELPFIELLRSKLVLDKLGVTYFTGMTNGKFSIPRQSGAATAYWVAEEGTVSSSNATLDAVAFTDKTLGALTNISRKFIYQTSVDAEAFVKNDLALVLAIALESAAIQGSGSGAVPTGILNNTTIQTNSSGLALGTSGGSPTFSSLVNMETQVASYNADRGSMAYLTTPAARGTLKTTAKIGSTFPVFLWEDDGYTENNVPLGNVNGYRAFATNNVPSNTTKGSGNWFKFNHIWKLE